MLWILLVAWVVLDILVVVAVLGGWAVLCERFIDCILCFNVLVLFSLGIICGCLCGCV